MTQMLRNFYVDEQKIQKQIVEAFHLSMIGLPESLLETLLVDLELALENMTSLGISRMMEMTIVVFFQITLFFNFLVVVIFPSLNHILQLLSRS